MLKKSLAIILAASMMLCFTGCSGGETENAASGKAETSSKENPSQICTHTYSDATCTEAKKCKECGETSGTALGHDFAAATCDAPQKCKRCGTTSGTALGHKFTDATCTAAKKCTVCGTTNGSALGHDYKSSSCTAEQKCARCGQTSAATGHTYLAATCTEPQKCKRCGATTGSALGHTTSAGKCSRCGKAIEDKDQKLVLDGAYSVIKKWLYPNLKNPSSLIINKVSFGKFESKATKGEFVYRLYVDYSAMNGFGGYNRETETYFCDNEAIYTLKDISNYTVVTAGKLNDENLKFLNDCF